MHGPSIVKGILAILPRPKTAPGAVFADAMRDTNAMRCRMASGGAGRGQKMILQRAGSGQIHAGASAWSKDHHRDAVACRAWNQSPRRGVIPRGARRRTGDIIHE